MDWQKEMIEIECSVPVQYKDFGLNTFLFRHIWIQIIYSQNDSMEIIPPDDLILSFTERKFKRIIISNSCKITNRRPALAQEPQLCFTLLYVLNKDKQYDIIYIPRKRS